MHEFRRLIEDEMSRHPGMTKASLARAADLSKTYVTDLLNDDTDHLGKFPAAHVIDGFQRALGISRDRLERAAARSLGRGDIESPLLVPTVKGVPDDELVAELQSRLRRLAGSEALRLLDIDALPDPKAVPQLIEFHDGLVKAARSDRAAGNAGLAEAKEWLAGILDAAFKASAAVSRRRRNSAAAPARPGRR